jgi:hypothetical protein
VEQGRNEAAWQRAATAKRAFAAVASVTFLAGIVLVRAHVPSHPKRSARPLAAPKAFTDVVRRDLLAAGIMAPAEAPADVATAVS